MYMYLPISLLAAWLLMRETSGYCFHGNIANRGCQFTCHCQEDAPCDEFTGECPGTAMCDKASYVDWSGPGCQRGNVGQDKPAWSTQAPDGKYCVDGNGSTSCTLGPDEHYVIIDLTTDHYIEKVGVTRHSRNSKRQHKYDVTVLDADNNVVESFATYGSVRFGQIGRKVKVGNANRYTARKSSGTANVLVGEITVTGYQYVTCEADRQRGGNSGEVQYYYGPGCLMPCPDGCSEQCDYVTGRGCEVCKPGYQGLHCAEKCRPGRWGEQCQGRCRCDEEGEACHVATGACSSGCMRWYAGESCSHHLPSMADIPEPSAQATTQLLTVNFTQWTPDMDGDSAGVYYRITYRRAHDDGVTTPDYVIQHVQGQEFNVVTLLSPFADDSCYVLCVVAYDVVYDMPGLASPCTSVSVDNS